jgi:hypothetical protein
MQGPIPSDCHAIAVHIQRLLDETLDRHASGSEVERVQALVDTLRAELRRVSVTDRAPTLAALRALNPEPELFSPRAPQAPTLRELELEAEVEQLRAALVEQPLASTATPGETERALVRALVGSGRDLDELLVDPAMASRAASVARSLVEFTERLGRVFLGAIAETDHTMAGRIRGLVTDVVLGRAEPDVLADAFEHVFRQIGGQILAFREACETGARDLLKQLGPAAIEAEVARAGTGVGRRFFFHKECWELFGQRHEVLRSSDELFETYFNGPYRGALLRQAQGRPGGDRS